MSNIEKLISSKGYVKGNIWVISLRANRIKVEERLLQSNNSYKEE